jgi:hypothetical protein
LDARGDVLPAAFAGHNEIAEGGIWPLKHETIVANKKANKICEYPMLYGAILNPQSDPQD